LSAELAQADIAVIERENELYLYWNDSPASLPLTSDLASGVSLDDHRVVLAGRLVEGAATVEVVAPDGHHVQAMIASGAWLAVVADNNKGVDAYPVLHRDANGKPVLKPLPSDFSRQPSDRTDHCPVCGATEWDVAIAAWERSGSVRSTRWGIYGGDQPGRAWICRTCGHEQRIAPSHTY
jgi:hypothetical protein